MKLHFVRRIFDLSSLRILALISLAMICATSLQIASAQTTKAYTNPPLIGTATPSQLQQLRTEYLRKALQPRIEDILPSLSNPNLRTSASRPAGRVAFDVPSASTASVVTSTEQTVDATLTGGLVSGFQEGDTSNVEAPWYSLNITTGVPTTATPDNTDVIWSHNESFLVFSSNITGYYQLYAISSSGGPIAYDTHNNAIYVQQLTGLTNATATTNIRYPSLLGPNDTSIAYCADDLGNGVFQLYVSPFNNTGAGYSVDQNTSDIVPLATAYTARHPFYIGDEIYFSGKARSTDSYNIYSVSVATGIVTQITGPTAGGFDNDYPNVSAYNQLAWDSTAAGFQYNVPGSLTPVTSVNYAPIANGQYNIYFYVPGTGVEPATTQSTTYSNRRPVWTTGNDNDFVAQNDLDLFFDSNRVSLLPQGNTGPGHSIYYFPAYVKRAENGVNTTTTAAAPAWVSGNPTAIQVTSTTGFSVGDSVAITSTTATAQDEDVVILGITAATVGGVTNNYIQVDNANAHNLGSTVTDLNFVSTVSTAAIPAWVTGTPTSIPVVSTTGFSVGDIVSITDPNAANDEAGLTIVGITSFPVNNVQTYYLQVDNLILHPAGVVITDTTVERFNVQTESQAANEVEVNTSNPTHEYDDEEVAVSSLTPPYISVAYISNRYLFDTISDNPLDENEFTNVATETTAEGLSTNYLPSDVEPVSEASPGTEVLISRLQVLDPPALIRFNESDSEVVHVFPGDVSAYTASLGTTGNPTTTHYVPAGQDATFVVRLSDRQVGVGQAWLQIKDPESAYQDTTGLEHKVYTQLQSNQFHPNTNEATELWSNPAYAGFNAGDGANGRPIEVGNQVVVASNPAAVNSYTSLAVLASPGSGTITVNSDAGFAPGDTITIASTVGGQTESVAIAAVNPFAQNLLANGTDTYTITLASTLNYAHNPGQSVTDTTDLGGGLNGYPVIVQNGTTPSPGIGSTTIYVSGDPLTMIDTQFAVIDPGQTDAEVVSISGFTPMVGTTRAFITLASGTVDGHGFGEPIDVIGNNDEVSTVTSSNGNGTGFTLYQIPIVPSTVGNFNVGDVIGILPAASGGLNNISTSGPAATEIAEITSINGSTLIVDQAILNTPATETVNTGLNVARGDFVYYIASTAFDPLGQEVDCQAIDTSLQANNNGQDVISALPQDFYIPRYTPGVDDGGAFPNAAPPLNAARTGSYWLQLQPLPAGEQDKNGGVLYYATWNTPLDPSDYYIDVIAEDASYKSNWRIYDNSWGFTTQSFQATNSILVVNDYALPQKFFAGTKANSRPATYGVESYWTDISTNIAGWQSYYGAPNNSLSAVDQTKAPTVVLPLVAEESNSAGTGLSEVAKILWGNYAGELTSGTYFPAYANGLGVNSYYDTNFKQASSFGTGAEQIEVANAQKYDIWRILSRGPIPSAVMQSYGATTQQMPVDPFTDTTYSPVVAPSCVVWLSPYAGNNYVGPGTITDPSTQTLLEAFLNGGGRLHIEGASIGYALSNNNETANAFYDTYLNQEAGQAYLNDGGGPGTTVTANANGLISTDAYIGGAGHAYDTPTGYSPPSSKTLTIAHVYGSGNSSTVTPDTRSDASLYAAAGYLDQFNSNGTNELTSSGGGQDVLYLNNNNGSIVSYSSFGMAPISQEVEVENYAQVGPDAYDVVNQRTDLIHNVVCALRTGTITGHITATGNAAQSITNAIVVASGGGKNYTAVSNGSGNFSINGVPAGYYSVVAYKQGYSFQINAATTSTHGGDSGSVNLSLSLSGNGSLNVYVVSTAQVATLTNAAGALTSSLTLSSVAGLNDGESIVIDAGSASVESVIISTINGLTVTTTTPLQHAHASGAVINLPLPGATVTPAEVEAGAAPSPESTSTSGLAAFPSVPTGNYTVTGAINGYGSLTSPLFTIAQSNETSVTLELTPLPLTISGLVYVAGTSTTSSLSSAYAAGVTQVEIISPIGFAAGQTAEIGQGTANDEYVTISAVNSTLAPYTLTISATAKQHAIGEPVFAAVPILTGAGVTLTNSTGTTPIPNPGGGIFTTLASTTNGSYSITVPSGDIPANVNVYVSANVYGYYPSDPPVGIGPPNATEVFTGIGLPLVPVPVGDVIPPLTITPASGPYVPNQTVTFSDTLSGVVYYYTTDGTNPGLSPAGALLGTTKLYNAGITLTPTPSETINVIGTEVGYYNSPQNTATYIIGQTVPTPTITTGGAFTTTQTVAFSDTLAGVTYYYTTDGVAPVAGHADTTAYNPANPIVITSTPGETITVIATEAGYINSASVTATYIVAQTVPTPVVASAPTAPSVAPITVSITDTLGTSAIYYTTDGTLPVVTAGVPQGTTKAYSGAFVIASTPLAGETVNAIAQQSGYFQSLEATANFVVGQTVPTPTISPVGGAYTAGQAITFTDPTLSGATFYFTTDGQAPVVGNQDTTQYNPLTPPTIINTASETVSVIGVETGYTTSASVSATYIIGQTVPTPVITTTPSNISVSPVTVTIGESLAGAAVYYTTDGTTPSVVSGVPQGTTALYSGPFTVSNTAGETVKAFSIESGYFNSTVATVNLIVDQTVPTPVISPVGGAYTTAQTVTFSDTLAGVSFYYTTDGNLPVVGRPDTFLYNGILGIPVPVTTGELITVVATETGYNNSSSNSGNYIIGQTAPTPVISPAGGASLQPITVTLNEAQPGQTVYYTTDGQTPVPGNGDTTTVTSGAQVTVSSSETITAIGGATGYFNSPPTSATFAIGATVPTPTFSPNGGPTTTTEVVTLSDTLRGVTFYYTSDGSTPTLVNGNPTGATIEYTAPFIVSQSETINAIGIESGYNQSGVATAQFTFGQNVPTPTISPDGGPTVSGVSVSLADTQPGVSLYYTTDGTIPTTSSTLYSGQFTVSTSETIKVIGVETGYFTSAVATAQFIIGQTAPSPTFNPAAGAYTTAQSIALADTLAGTSIYYTTDGSTPVVSGGLPSGTTQLYATAISIPSTALTGETIKAIAVETGYFTSNVSTATYVVDQTVPTPTFNPAPGPFTTAQNVTLADSLAGATIYYTTDGSTPTANSTPYTTAIPVTATETIKAIAVDAGFFSSAVVVGTYTIGQFVPTPTISPNGGPYLTWPSVTLSDAFNTATIYYTVDGTTPNPGNPGTSVYNGTPLNLSSTGVKVLKAVAENPGYVNSLPASATFDIDQTVPNPTISPNGQASVSPIPVTLADPLQSATLYYTTDGTTASVLSGIPQGTTRAYTTPIIISNTESISAIAVAANYNNSATVSALFTIGSSVTAPTIDTPAGAYTTTVPVTITTNQPGSTIYYTLDGSIPTTLSTPYTAPISVSTTETVKAIAAQSGFNNSAVVAAQYIIGQSVPTPTITPPGGLITTSTLISLTDTLPGALIYYATSGSPVPGNPNTTQYSGPFTLSASSSLDVIAEESGYLSSGAVKVTFTLTTNVQTPVISVQSGAYTAIQTVAITDPQSSVQIYYTTDGSTPTALSTPYSNPISVASSETINAIAVAANYINSAVASATYTLTLTAATPTISPAGGTYSTAKSVTIADTDPLAQIYYTTDGSTPSSSSALYSSPLTVLSTQTINAIAIHPGYANSSAVTTATYTIIPQLPTPVISPSGGIFNTVQTVTITDPNGAGMVYYTLDNSTPTSSSTQYTGPITVNSSETIKAIAAASGYLSSAAASAQFTVTLPTPTPVITPNTGVLTTPLTVTITDSQLGASIYYTVNGTTPTTSSTVYSGPITVSSPQTITAIATATGYSTSQTASASFQNAPTAPVPTISPNGGPYATTRLVTLTDTLSGSAIYYTTDGTTPTIASTLYSGAISVSSSQTITAIAAENGYNNSGPVSATFTIGQQTPAPAISPNGGSFTSVQSVTLSDSNAGSQIYYTLDGSTPSTSSTLYTGPISVGVSETITAIAIANGYTASSVASAAFTINLPVVASFGAGLQLISLPESYVGVSPDSIFGYSDVRLAVWEPLAGIYAITPTPPANQVVPGQGYWVRFPHAVAVTLQGTPVPTNANFVISLQPGWNLVGDPFNSSVAISSLKLNVGSETFAQASSGTSPLVGSTLYAYDSSSNSYVSATSLAPDQGYWIFAYSATDLDVAPPSGS